LRQDQGWTAYDHSPWQASHARKRARVEGWSVWSVGAPCPTLEVCMVEVVAEVTHPGVVVVGLVVVGDEGGGNSSR
jgi:hypothetical protein